MTYNFWLCDTGTKTGHSIKQSDDSLLFTHEELRWPWASPRLEEATPISAGVRALDQHSFTGSSSIQQWLEAQSLNWSLEAWILVFWGRSQRCLLPSMCINWTSIYISGGFSWPSSITWGNVPKYIQLLVVNSHFGQTNCWSNPSCCWSSPNLFLVDICFIA